MYLTKFGQVQQNTLEAQWAEPVSFTFHSVLRKLDAESCIGASYQISVHLATWLEEKTFFKPTN